MATFGSRFKELRKEKKLTQEQLANQFFLNKSSISRYENNNQVPETDTLKKFADFFNVSTDYLLGRSDKRTEAIEPTLPEDFTPETFAAKLAPELEGYSELPDEAKQTLKEVLSFLYNKYGVHKKKED